jgi:ubiquinone/menaquinone biosynthesis C-methylase UbiE
MMTVTETTWDSDFFGTVNEMPPEPVELISTVLEAMASEPGFQRARRQLFQDLRVPARGSVVEGGCGTGTALRELRGVLGRDVSITGVDPSLAFLDRARRRAEADTDDVSYLPGDARSLPLPDHSVDAAFCDKVLLHVSPPSQVLAELARVTKPGGRVGALEWLPYFAISTTDPDLADRYNLIYRLAVSNYYAAANLERHLAEAGLHDIEARTSFSSTRSLDAHPFWRLFLLAQIPLFVHAGGISAEDGQRFAQDVEELDRAGHFSAAFVIRTATGRTSTAA